MPVHIYHLKAAGQENWPLMADALALIDSARAAGMDVTADIYPYIRNGIGLGSFLHPRHYAAGTRAFLSTLGRSRASVRRAPAGGRDDFGLGELVPARRDGLEQRPDRLRLRPEVDPAVVNRSVAEAAEVLGTDPWNAFFDLVQAGGVSVNPQSMNEEQKHLALRAEYVMIDTDASPVNPESTPTARIRAPSEPSRE